MNNALLAALEEKIEEWTNEECESDRWFSGGIFYWPEDQVANMARAAAAVFDANKSGQAFYEQEND